MNFRISIVIPAIDEAFTINETVSGLKSLRFACAPEIVVVDGRSDRSTVGAILEKDVIRLMSAKGRSVQMNAGARVCTGDVLLFLHADTLLPEDAPVLIEKAVVKDGAKAGAFDLGIRSEKSGYRLIEKMVWLRTRLTRIPYGDQAIFVERKFFERLGGYAPIVLMEDVELMRRIKRRGERIAIIPRKTRTSARRWEKEGIVFCTLRNWLLASLYYAGVSPERLSRFYG